MKISVVTPSFNQAPYIERTIRSVLDQPHDELDYRVIDGGSQDSTIDILRRYQDHLSWFSGTDQGQASAVNRGLRESDGEIIGWLNSDDVYISGCIPAVMQVFSAHPEIDVVYGNANHIGEEDQVIEPYPIEDWSQERLYETCFICQPATFFRRRMIDKFGLLDETLDFCMDYEFWIRLSQGGACFERLPVLLADSRMYPSNKTVRHRRRVHWEINQMLRRRLGRVPDRWVFNYAHAWADHYSARKHGIPFVVLVSLASWWASLRWNRTLSHKVRETTMDWLRGAYQRRQPRSR